MSKKSMADIMKEIEKRRETEPQKSLQDIIEAYKPEEYVEDVQKVLEMGYEYACDLHPGDEEDETAWREACQQGAKMVLAAAIALNIDRVGREAMERASSHKESR